MIKPEHLTVDAVLFDRHTHKCGRTPVRALGEWSVMVRIVRRSGDQITGAHVSWNGNSPEYWPWYKLRKLYTWSMYEPHVVVTKRNIFGDPLAVRRMTKRELAANVGGKDEL